MSGNPSAWKPGKLDPRRAAGFRRFIHDHDLNPVFLHAGYLVNLSCRRGRNASIYAKSVWLLQENIDRAAALGCGYVVVHMGSRKGTGGEAAQAALLEGISRLRPPEPDRCPTLLLENSAGAGDSVGASLEEMALVLGTAAKRKASIPLGICLDTAHLWAAGYNLATPAAVRRFVEAFDRAVGLERLHLIHLNDAAVERGSRKDKHEHPGCGLIPYEGLRTVARHLRLRHIPMIMETPGRTEPDDGKRVRDLKKLAGVKNLKSASPRRAVGS